MANYQADLGFGYVIKHYGQGLMMLKASNRSQGRNLFFFSKRMDDPTSGETLDQLVVVLIYKKESQEAPSRLIETARQRMRAFQHE